MGRDEDDFVIAPDRDGRRTWWIVAAIAIVVVAASAGAWVLLHRPGREPTVVVPPVIEPSQPTTTAPASEATSATAATETATPGEATPTVPGGQESTGTPVAPQRPKRPPYLALRESGTVYIAREDGTRAIPIVNTEGVFALSPDARSLAYVDPSSGRLAIVDLSTQTTRTAGPARQATPRWSADSSSVVIVRDAAAAHGTELVSVARSSGKPTLLGMGTVAAVSPDGSVVALVPPALHPSSVGALALLKGGRPWKTVRTPGPVLDLAIANDRAYVATAKTAQDAAAEGVWELSFEGGSRLLSGAVEASEPGDFGTLALSDDGHYLAYARVGDDGRSRTWWVRTSGGPSVPVASRRDVYPLWWSADSSALFAIEGNSWQGEQTALVRVTPAGAGKSVIVLGADR